MAVIEKIRSKAGLLIAIVGVSLVAFILGDLFSSGNSFFGGSDTHVGEINGHKINVMDFEAKVQQSADNYKLSNNTETIDQNTMDQIRDQTWNTLINEMVMEPQFEKLGLTCTPEEVMDMIQGKNPHPQIKQAFTDPKTGQFNPSSVVNFLKNMDNDPSGKTRKQWVAFERAIQDERVQNKYYNLIKGGLYVSKAEARDEFFNRNRTYSMRFVSVPYATITDSSVAVTDAELTSYYNANKNKYKQESSVNIEYVTFDVNPSVNDRQTAYNAISSLSASFAGATNDSAFIAVNSDMPYNGSFSKKGGLSPSIDSVMNNAPVGQIAGPYEENNMFRIAKLSAVKFLPDSVKSSHILLRLENPADKDKVFARADSIKTALQKGADFKTMSDMFSTDEGSKTKGGDLGWFSPGMMVKEFNDACFEGKKGDYTIVQTQFGIHVIHITDQGKPARQVKVVYLDKKIEPSSKTYQEVYSKANAFAGANTTADSFDKAVNEQKLTKMSEATLMENARQVGPLENSREIIRWAFKANIGEVSKAYECGNRFAIAKLVDKREKGFSTLEQVKEQLLFEARRDKKAEMLIEKCTKAGSSNLDAIASALAQPVMTADNISFASPYLPNGGMEGNVVGHLVTMKNGQLSKPLKGMNGVYVLQVTAVADVKEPASLKDIQDQAAGQLKSRSQYEVFNALREKANVMDNRAKFY